MRTLVYSNRATGGREGKTNNLHMRILQGRKMDLMSTVRDAANNIGKYAKVGFDSTINPYEDFYHREAINMASWEEIYQAIDVQALLLYDNIHTFGGLFKPQSGFRADGARVGRFPKDNGQIKFQSTAIELVHFLAILKANREYGTPVHEFCLDPDPFRLDSVHKDYQPTVGTYHAYHGYETEDLYRLDSAQHFYKARNEARLFGAPTKQIDFMFGYTVINDEYRKGITDHVDELASKFPVSQVFLWNKYTGTDSYIDRDAYLSMLERSRFTYVIPAYNQKYFSIYRLIEAFAHDCLPIIHPDCRIDQVEESFSVDLRPLIECEIPTESQRKELLAEYKPVFTQPNEGFIGARSDRI